MSRPTGRSAHFICPHCMTYNACVCENCMKSDTPQRRVLIVDDHYKCAYCGKEYGPDQSCDLDMEIYEAEVHDNPKYMNLYHQVKHNPQNSGMFVDA